MTNKTESSQRQLAHALVLHCKNNLGMSYNAVLEALDNGEFSQPEYASALYGLRDRGELEHLMEFVFSFKKLP